MRAEGNNIPGRILPFFNLPAMEPVLLPTRDPEDEAAPRWLHRRRHRGKRRKAGLISRRSFLRRAFQALAGLGLAGGAYGLGEAKWCRLHAQDEIGRAHV